jgi:hypothetical protein
MSELVTIISFTFPSELAVIKARLESEGIRCYTKDEFTVQVHNFYSNAIGGIKLQVHESDEKRAVEILKKNGLIKEEQSVPSKFWTKFNTSTSYIPFIGEWRIELRLFILVGMLIFTLLGFYHLATMPDQKELLTAHSWCVSYVLYEGKKYIPKTIDTRINGEIMLRFDLGCETLKFNNYGTVCFPGFNSSYIYGNWELAGNKLQIKETENFQHVFNGTYKMKLKTFSLTLISENTEIYCLRY